MQVVTNSFDFTGFLKEPERSRVQNMSTDERREYQAKAIARAKAANRQLYRGVFVHMHKWNTKGKRGSGRRCNRRHGQQWMAYPRYRGPAARRRRNKAKKEG